MTSTPAPDPMAIGEPFVPGEIRYGEGEVLLNVLKPATTMEVTNTGDRAVQVGSHYHFFEVNAALRFPRDAAFGTHLDIPSGTSTRFEAGQTHTVGLVPFGGARRMLGFAGLTAGKDLAAARAQAAERGFDLGDAGTGPAADGGAR